MSDTRWMLSDTMDQMKGILELHERSKKWMKSRLDDMKKEQNSEINELGKSTKALRLVVQNYKEGNRGELLKALHADRELERICYKLSPEEIVETLEQIVFCKRKEYDRIKYELDRKEDEFYKSISKIEEMKASDEKKVIPVIVMKGNEVSNKIQRVLLQQEAARIVETSYEKMRKVLEKDSRCFDAVLAGLKIDTIIQCQCIIRSMELGQSATEDKHHLMEEYKEESQKVKEITDKQTEKVKDMKKNVARVKEAYSDVVQTDSFTKIPTKLSSIASEAYRESLLVKENQLLKDLEKLMETTLALSFDQIFVRCEESMKEKYRLLKQLEINTIWRDTELMRKNHMEALYESLIHSAVEGVKEHEQERKSLKDEIEHEKYLCEEYKKQHEQHGEYMLKIRTAMLHFNKLLSRVSLDKPDESFEELHFNREDIPSNNTEGGTPAPSADHLAADKISNKLTDDSNIDTDVNHIIDTLILKAALLVKQCSLRELTEKEMEEAKELYAVLIAEEAGAKREPLRKPELDELHLQKIPTRNDLKTNSQLLVEQKEAKPPPPNPYAKLVKHDCY